jgi:hypothetical protein
MENMNYFELLQQFAMVEDRVAQNQRSLDEILGYMKRIRSSAQALHTKNTQARVVVVDPQKPSKAKRCKLKDNRIDGSKNVKQYIHDDSFDDEIDFELDELDKSNESNEPNTPSKPDQDDDDEDEDDAETELDEAELDEDDGDEDDGDEDDGDEDEDEDDGDEDDGDEDDGDEDDGDDCDQDGGCPAFSNNKRLRAGDAVLKRTVTQQRWWDNFENLKEYMQVHGGVGPPRTLDTPRYRALGNWVSHQRDAWRNMVKLKSGERPRTIHRLSQKRIAALNSIRFDWKMDRTKSMWDRKYREFYAFVQEQLHERDQSDKKDFCGTIPPQPIRAWLSEQAGNFSRYTAGKGSIGWCKSWNKRFGFLEELGVVFGPLQGAFSWSLPK